MASGDQYTGRTIHEALIKATLAACKPCCGGGSGSGSGDWDGSYTDCLCAVENYQFNPEDPVKPIQPACAYYPTVIYYITDLSGDCSSCYLSSMDLTTYPCGGAAPITVTATAATMTSYCEGQQRIVLRWCQNITTPVTFEGRWIPLCDLTVTFSNGSVVTFRRYIQVVLTIECGTCGEIDASSFEWPEGFDYTDWLGLQLATPGTVTINRFVQWVPVGGSLTAPFTTVSAGLLPSEGGSAGINIPCYPQVGAFYGINGGRIYFQIPSTSISACTDLVLKTVSYSPISQWTQSLFCCSTNLFDNTVTGCCVPTAERLVCPC